MDHRLSVIPVAPEERQGPPGLLGRPLPACRGATHPAGYDPALPLLLFEKIYGEVAIAFARNRTLGIRDEYSFRGHLPTAHTLVCLRFAGLVTETVARLTTGSGGLTLDRADFASAGRRTKFHGVIGAPG